MAVVVEERSNCMNGTRMTASAAVVASIAPFTIKRRAASSATTVPTKRQKNSNASLNNCKPPNTSSINPTLPGQRTPDAPYAGVPTLTRTYHDFSHFLRAMDPDIREKVFEEIEDTGLVIQERWRSQHYDPLYATEACKIAFLIQAESKCYRSMQDSPGERKKKRKIEEPEIREYACYRCYTLQPKAAFEDKPPHIVVSSCGRLTMHDWAGDLPTIQQGECLLRRYCIECGIKDGLYPNKALITSMDDNTWWVCACRLLHWVAPDELYVECGQCAGKSGFRPFVPERAGAVSADSASHRKVVS